MTGPRIDRPAGADAHGTPIIPRALTYEEWQQAQGMSAKAIGATPFPSQPPEFKPDAAGRMGALNDGIVGAAQRDVTRTPMDRNTAGKTQSEFARTSKGVGGVIDNIAAPVIDHPWMTAGAMGASMIPVVGPYIGAAMMGDMASNVALYGYQRHLEHQASPEARKIMEADPERISGEAATAQAIMLGLTPLTYVGGKALGARVEAASLAADRAASMEIPVKVSTPARALPLQTAEPRAVPRTTNVADMEIPIGTNKFIADLEAGVAKARIPNDVERPKGFEGSKAASAPTRQPKHPSGYSVDNPFAPENVKIKPIETTTPADQLQSVAEKANDPMRPRRRAAIETPEGAQLLGSVAQRNGLDVESNPFPPETPLHDAWKTGHEEAASHVDRVASAPLEPLPAYPEGFSMGGALTDNRIPDVAPLPGLKGNRPIGKARGVDGPSVPAIDAPPAPAADPAPVADAVAAPSAPAQAGGLAPVEGTGAETTRSVSRGIEARALASGVAETLGELPKYRRANFEEHAAKALELLAADPALAREVAMGNKPAPDGMIPEMVSAAVERKAINEGDVGTLRDLATSKLAEEGTTMGQRIAALGTRDPESPVGAIQDVIAARTKNVKDIAKATDTEVAAIEDHIGKVGIDTPTWTKFVDSLRC